MKTILASTVLCLLSLVGFSQAQKYYTNENILKVKEKEYLCKKKDNGGTFLYLYEKNKPSNYVNHMLPKDPNNPIPKEAEFNYTVCSIENESEYKRIVAGIISKYGFKAYFTREDAKVDGAKGSGSLGIIIDFETSSRKVVNIGFLISDKNRLVCANNSVPIEVYDELNRELSKKLTCIPNEYGLIRVYCRQEFKVYAKKL